MMILEFILLVLASVCALVLMAFALWVASR